MPSERQLAAAMMSRAAATQTRTTCLASRPSAQSGRHFTRVRRPETDGMATHSFKPWHDYIRVSISRVRDDSSWPHRQSIGNYNPSATFPIGATDHVASTFFPTPSVFRLVGQLGPINVWYAKNSKRSLLIERM